LGKLNRDNLRKTVYYLKKNGWKNTVLAAVERLQKKEQDTYTYISPAEEVLRRQRQRVWENPVVFSAVVPVYHTPKQYFCEMVESVLKQTYPYFELILADAGKDESLKVLAEKYEDPRIRYIKLADNAGIAENTNQAILASTGDFVVLFDHDDLLTADALYEMAEAIRNKKMKVTDMSHDISETTPVLLYSDEDKCDGSGSVFYDPHFKLDYDPDLLLTNNYFCHLTVVRADVAKRFLLRKAYDGAQDFDFVLRVTAEAGEDQIIHIPKVLYHWRCHIGSTAANPESKRYAYESGKRAVEDYVNKKGWDARVSHLKHLGFYRVDYEKGIFKMRPEVGAVGGRILGRKKIAGIDVLGSGWKITGGMMDEKGRVLYEGLRDGFSGYVNRAALQQQAAALDLRCMKINPACWNLCEEVLERYYAETAGGSSENQRGMSALITAEGRIEWEKLPQDTDYVALSLEVSRALRKTGYILLWDPQMVEKV